MNRVAGIGQRRVGMDHELYTPSSIVSRAPLSFGTHRVAAYLVLHLEHWELAPPEGALRDPRFKGEFGTYQPEYRNWSTRAYGNRVGFYRIAALLDEMGITPTVALGAAMVQMHPEIVTEVIQRQWDIAAHGFSANRMVSSKMDLAQERAFLTECRDVVAGAIGRDPTGWLSQDFGTTPHTTELLYELGFEYTLDWSNDDQPYWQRAGGQDKALVAMPAPTELDDVQNITLRKLPPQHFVRLVDDAMDGALSLAHGQAFAIGIHPWVLGAPHRVRYLRDMLTSLRARNDIHLTTAGALAGHFRNLTKDS